MRLKGGRSTPLNRGIEARMIGIPVRIPYPVAPPDYP